MGKYPTACPLTFLKTLCSGNSLLVTASYANGLLKKPNTVGKRVTRSGDKSERPIKRMERIQYRGVTPATRSNGCVVWKVHHRYNTPKWRYDSQIESATAIVRADGLLTLADLKHNKAKLPSLKVDAQQQLHGKAMAL